jgi:hypothetical protein
MAYGGMIARSFTFLSSSRHARFNMTRAQIYRSPKHFVHNFRWKAEVGQYGTGVRNSISDISGQFVKYGRMPVLEKECRSHCGLIAASTFGVAMI